MTLCSGPSRQSCSYNLAGIMELVGPIDVVDIGLPDLERSSPTTLDGAEVGRRCTYSSSTSLPLPNQYLTRTPSLVSQLQTAVVHP